MDRFTRNYSVILAVIVLSVLAWILYENPDVSALNNLLEQNSEVAGYPYAFKVLRLHNGIAIMNTPRSSQFPVYRALGIIFPSLANRAQDDPDVMQAQQDLARVQARAKAVVMASGKVTGIQWELDVNWLSRHGVQVDSVHSRSE